MPKLTNTLIERFKGGQRIATGSKAGELVQNPVLWDDTLAGFGVRYAMRSGTRTFIFKARIKGSRELTITIGRFLEQYIAEDDKPAVWTVEVARARAHKLKGEMSSGHDPAKRDARLEVMQKAQSVTLRQMVSLYCENKRTKSNRLLRPKTKSSIQGAMERNLDAWLDKPMAETITRDACVARFTELSDIVFNHKTKKAGKHASANQTFVYLRALCNYARDHYEDEQGNPLIFVNNPVSRMVKVRRFNEIKARDERIPRDKIGAVWNALRARAADARTDLIRTSADWLCVALLCGGRLTETGAMLKANVNLEDKTVLLPGSITDVPGFHGTKNHRDLKLPLSTPLVEILTARMTTVQDDTAATRRRKRERDALYVFPTNGKVKPYVSEGRKALNVVNEIAGGKKRITMHSLRRTFEDILMFAKVDPYQREILLNHINSGAHGASYANNREDDVLRPAMQAAADWVLEQARIAASPNVISFPVKQQA